MKTAWKRHLEDNAAIAKKGFKDPHWRSRYGARGSNRKNRPGAGRKRILKQAEEELATQVKAEEEAHGHRLGPEDILLLWREKLSQVAVNLYRESKSLAEKDCLGKEKKSSCRRPKTT